MGGGRDPGEFGWRAQSRLVSTSSKGGGGRDPGEFGWRVQQIFGAGKAISRPWLRGGRRPIECLSGGLSAHEIGYGGDGRSENGDRAGGIAVAHGSPGHDEGRYAAVVGA